MLHASDRIAEAKLASRSGGGKSSEWSGPLSGDMSKGSMAFDVGKAVSSLEDRLKQDFWDALYEVTDRESGYPGPKEEVVPPLCEMECRVPDVEAKGSTAGEPAGSCSGGLQREHPPGVAPLSLAAPGAPECTPEGMTPDAEEATASRKVLSLKIQKQRLSADFQAGLPADLPAFGKGGTFVPLSPTQKSGTPSPTMGNPFRNFSASGSEKSTPLATPQPMPPRARHLVFQGGPTAGLKPQAPPRSHDEARAHRMTEPASSRGSSPKCSDDRGLEGDCSDDEPVRLPTITPRTSKIMRVDTAA